MAKFSLGKDGLPWNMVRRARAAACRRRGEAAARRPCHKAGDAVEAFPLSRGAHEHTGSEGRGRLAWRDGFCPAGPRNEGRGGHPGDRQDGCRRRKEAFASLSPCHLRSGCRVPLHQRFFGRCRKAGEAEGVSFPAFLASRCCRLMNAVACPSSAGRGAEDWMEDPDGSGMH